jgi:hypothetical protein
METTAAPPAVRVRTLWTPKSGHTAEEYEDAFAARADAWPVRAAVADGATESAFARAWARRLATGYVERAPANATAFAATLPAWQAEWQEAIDAQAETLPWYAAAKAEQGAFAALLGLTLRRDAEAGDTEAGGTFEALAVGDCVLLHLRGLALARAWPLARPGDFDHHPALVPSRPAADAPAAATLTGRWQPGDAFALATDAVAAWLLRTGPAVARVLRTPFAFGLAVETGRLAGTCANDDSTLVVVEVEG